MRPSILVVSVALALSAAPRAQRSELRVQVVDFDSGVPILRAQLSSASAQPFAPIFTDEHGQASVDAPTSAHTLRVSKPGYVPQSIAINPASGDIDVRLPHGAAISGRIVDAGGSPVAARPVLVTSAAAEPGRLPRTVYSDDLGEYRIGSLPAGTYIVSLNVITAPGAGAAATAPTLDALPHTVVLRRGEDVGGIDFSIASQLNCRPPPAFGFTGNRFVYASVSGRVTTTSGAPLSCVEVVAYRNGPVSSAITDRDGNYSLPRLRAGTFRLEFKRPGYVGLQWGQTESGQPGRPVVVRDLETLRRIDVSLSRGGAISGTVVDEFGEPVENVVVRALQLRGDQERAIAVVTLSVATDDRGRYRLSGLLPGRYIVGTQATADPPDLRTGRGYAPAYYPGTVEIAGAIPVDVREHGDRQWTDFARAATRVATITGTAVNSRNEPITDRVILVASQRSGAVIAETQGAEVKGPDGAFTIPNVPPGDYVLQATSKRANEEPPEFGSEYVTVGQNDPLPVRMQTMPGVELHGRLTLDGVPPVDPRAFSLIAVPVDWDQTSLLSGTEHLSTDAAGMLSLSGVTGPRRFVLASAPPNWYLKSVRVRGREVTDEVMGFATRGFGFIRDLEVVVSNRGGTLEGEVLDGSKPASDYSVVLFSTNPDHWFHNSRFVKTTRGNITGKFRAEALPDGEYFVVAIDPLDGTAGDAWQARDFLQSLALHARRVRLRDGDSRTVSLVLTRR